MATPQQGLTPEFAVGYRAVMLDGLARELEITKKVLAAVPDAKADYRPDPNARTARELAWHIANTDVQFLDGIADLNFIMETSETKPSTTAELVEWYDKNFTRGLDRVRALTPGQLVTSVNFLGAFNLPVVFYLAFLNNHSIHHRGELATYLRPMGSKVPSIYGGSYDEPWTGAADTAA
ncbi:MAG TPA: DinB family protein [Terriglobales bacterium]|jgi:uncharacterized damage-inducible protein DinB|nr:DinB family protein [Terriglobales bacterium]